MILPAKHLRQDRALLEIGAQLLAEMQGDRTVSELWERVRISREAVPNVAPLSFDWFVLSLTFLYAISAVDFSDGIVNTR
jgi:hypothetical protein